ncbi:hypothetical protein [Flavobacterium sp.]|uniref:hypothetical protein n=1 Tax=Flavobacterium sp. TaxID=239 RepID=UPI003526C47E
MKKIVALFVFLFAFSFSTQAQENNAKAKSKAEVKELIEFLNLDYATTNDVYEVVLYKNTKKSSGNAYNQQELSNEVDLKLRELLSKEAYINLQSNTVLYKKIVE